MYLPRCRWFVDQEQRVAYVTCGSSHNFTLSVQTELAGVQATVGWEARDGSRASAVAAVNLATGHDIQL